MSTSVLKALFSVLVAVWIPAAALAQLPELDRLAEVSRAEPGSDGLDWLQALADPEPGTCAVSEPVITTLAMSKALKCGSCPGCSSSSACSGKRVGDLCVVNGTTRTCKSFSPACCSWLIFWETCCGCG